MSVRVMGEDHVWSEWSEASHFETSFLNPAGDFHAEMITPLGLGGHDDPAPKIFTHFSVDELPSKARLYISALGIYEATINGRRVGRDFLSPGWTSYHNRLAFQVHDVTDLLSQGDNRIEVTLGNGWWRGNLGRPPRRDLYGDRLGLIAQLEYTVGGENSVLVTDSSWRARSSLIKKDDLYNGQITDYTVQEGEPVPVSTIDFDKSKLTSQHSPPVQKVDQIPARSVTVQNDGKLLVDFGVNVVGWIRLSAKDLPSGAHVVIRHAEVLEGGVLGTRPLRTAEAKDEYVSAVPDAILEPCFTFHGFRYAEISGVTVEQISDVQAIVISSDLQRIGWFDCSNSQLNLLHENIVRSMRGNFISIPTDCPQRDERLGWTGDIQVFAPTAAFLFATGPFLGSWLRDLALEQKSDGSVPYVVPDIHGRDNPAACGWGDAATILPWVLYQQYADRDVLRAQYSSMKAWVTKIRELAGARRVWADGFQYGDWLDPTAPPNDPSAVMTPHELVATAFFAHSARMTADAAVVLGRDAEAQEYYALASEVRQAFAAEFVSEVGRLTSESQTSYALALNFGLIPAGDQRDYAAKRLRDLVRRSGFTVATGFLGTPLILDALAQNGGAQEAFRLLLQDQLPSWLYPVTQGATTVWERWDSMLENGDINPGQMTSFNHYAFGAVADWMHRAIGGLNFMEPGGRRVRIAPILGGRITSASVSHRTPYGKVEVAWQLSGKRCWLEVEVPVGMTAEVTLPERTEIVEVEHGRHAWEIEVSEYANDFSRAPCDREPTVRETLDDPELWDSFCRLAAETAGKKTGREVAEAVAPYFDRPIMEASRIAGHSTIRPGEIIMRKNIQDLIDGRAAGQGN